MLLTSLSGAAATISRPPRSRPVIFRSSLEKAAGWIFLTLLLLTITVPAVSAQMTFNLPQVANGGGVITTTIVAFNNANRRSEVVIRFRGDQGEALSMDFVGLGPTDTLSFGLEPGETRFLRTTGQGALQVGSAAAISTAPIGLSAIFSIAGAQGVITEAGVGSSNDVNAFAISVDTMESFNTGIALQNLSASENEVTFQVAAGANTFETTRTVAGLGHLAIFVAGAEGLFPNLGSVRGRMVIRSEAPVAAVTLRQGAGGAPLTTLPVVEVDATATSFELPQVAVGSTIATQFILFELGGITPAGASPPNVTIGLTDNDGAPLPVTLKNGQSGSSFSLPLDSSGVLFLETELSQSTRVGAATVQATAPIGVTAIFRLLDDQGNVVTEAGVGNSPSASAFSLPVDQTAGFGTGVAFFNNTNQAANLEIRFIGESGLAPANLDASSPRRRLRLPANSSIGLGPFGHDAQFVNQLIPGVGGQRGQLAVTSDVPVSALTLRQGATTLTTLPVTQGTAGGPDDLVRTETGVDLAQARFGVTGEGVIIAVMDRGIDYEHPDFIDEDGASRILYIVDLSDDTGAAAPGNPIGAGTIHTKAQIDAALTSGNRLATRDAVGHGTVTAGIAGGNGRASNGRYLGMAPRASFIIVKFTSEGAPAHDGEPAEDPFFASTQMAPVLDFILDKADQLGMPVVVTANFGSIQGPGDGTSLAPRTIDARFGPGLPGRAFITGTSDDGGISNHASGTIGAGQTIALEIQKGHPGPLRLDLWYPAQDRYDVEIVTPSGTFGPFAAPAGNGERLQQSTADFNYFHNGSLVDFFAATSDTREILIDFSGPVGAYVVRLTGAGGSSEDFNAVLNPSNIFSAPQNRFESFVTPGHTVWDWASAFNNIAPNSYVLQPTWTDIDGFTRTIVGNEVGSGALWPGSGVGPTFDGRHGVTLSAPGNSNIGPYATRSFFATIRGNLIERGNGFYGTLSFVSGASPVVTGIVALMLEADPSLDAAGLQNILRSTARQDQSTGPVPNSDWGFGKIDAEAAIEEVLRLKNQQVPDTGR